MILFILAIMLITGIILVLTSMKSTSFWLAGSFIGSILLIIAFMFYFAKSGGLSSRMEALFFLHSDIHHSFQYAIITIDQMSRMLSVGRAVFLFFSAGFVVRVNDIMTAKQKWIAYIVAFLFALGNYLIYEPVIYSYWTRFASEETHYVIAFFVRIVNVLYAIGVLYLLVSQLKRMKTPWLKSTFMIVFITVINLELIFLIFGVFSPLQVSDAMAFNYSFLGSLYHSSTFSLVKWYIMIAGSFVVTIIGAMALWKYNKRIGQIGKPEMMLEKKIRESNMGVRIFTHGIKNQILAQRVIIRNLKKRVEDDLPVDEGMLKAQLDLLANSNEKILQRMDELYGAFKSNRMRLKPTSLHAIYNDVLEKLEDDQRGLLHTREFENQFILADPPYLVQTICNLLSNAFDAVDDNKGLMRPPMVSFNCYQAGAMIVLEIKDNGIGIEKGHRQRIFEPFYTRKNSNTNWGLGLSYVQQTVKAHFGYVRFESKLGEGTTFYVYLPIYRSSAST